MAITLNGMTRLARIALAFVLLADIAVSSPYVQARWPAFDRFAWSYATAVTVLLAFHRRSLATLGLATVIVLTLIWGVTTDGGDVALLLVAVGGALCGFCPAYLRDYQRLAGGEDYLALAELKRVRRRRGTAAPIDRPVARRATVREHVIRERAAEIPDLRTRIDRGE